MNGFGRFMTKAFLRNTEIGKTLLGEQTDLEKAAERIQLLRQAEALRASLDAQQLRLDHTSAEAWASGHRHGVNPYVVADEIGGLPVVIRYYGQNDPTKIDIFYGGVGTPDGDNHGHITIRNGVIDTWWLPGPKNARERIV